MYADSSLTLVLNSAEARMQIACGNGTELLFAQEWHTPRHGMQVLIPALMQALEQQGLSLSMIGRIAVVNGPGSFTGLRLVLATALGLARPLHMTMAGIGYMHALAADTVVQHPLAPVWTITHARRNLVHIQCFCGHDAAGMPAALNAPNAATLDEAAALIGTGTGALLLGSGLHKNHAFFTEHCPGASMLPVRFNHPAPETLLALAALVEFSHEPVEPLYIRPCDAEENLSSIAAAKGINPDEARATLSKLTQS